MNTIKLNMSKKLTSIKEELRPSEGGVVGVWDVVTKILSYISLIEIFCFFYKRCIHYDRDEYQRLLKKEKKNEVIENDEKILLERMDKLYGIIELWVSVQVFVAIIVSLLVFYKLTDTHQWLLYLIVICASLRIFEIIIKQIRVILFDTIGKKAIILRSPRRSIILLIHNVVEMIFWFATSLMIVCLLEQRYLGRNCQYLSEVFNWGDFVKCSALQFTTFGDSYTTISNLIGHQTLLVNITFWEIIIGFIIIVISFARLFSLLPPAQDQVSDD